MSQLKAHAPERSTRLYGAGFGWETDTFDLGDAGKVTLWRVPGYLGEEPEQPVSREVVASMAPMSSFESPTEVAPYWSVDFWVDGPPTRLPRLGAGAIVSPFDTPVGRTAVLADPQATALSTSQVGPPT